MISFIDWIVPIVKYAFSQYCGLPWQLGCKKSSCSTGDMGLIPESGRSPEEGIATCSSILAGENPMGRRTWQTMVHGITESDATEANKHSTAVNIVQYSYRHSEDAVKAQDNFFCNLQTTSVIMNRLFIFYYIQLHLGKFTNSLLFISFEQLFRSETKYCFLHSSAFMSGIMQWIPSHYRLGETG